MGNSVSRSCLLVGTLLLGFALWSAIRQEIAGEASLQLVATDGMESLVLRTEDEVTRSLTIANRTKSTVRLINAMGWG